MTDDELKTVIDNSCKKAYDEIIKKTMVLFDKGNTPKFIENAGFKIGNKQDFAKGYAVCGLYMIANITLDTSFSIYNVIWSNRLLQYREELLEDYSKKISVYFHNL